MFNRRKRIILALGILASVFTAMAVVVTAPSTISRLAYAAESGKALAAKEQLARAVDLSQAFQYVAKALRPSVVSISSVRKIPPAFNRRRPEMRHLPEELRRFYGDDMSDRFFELPMPERGLEQRGMGTGVIVREDGYILTNNHVIRGADEVKVSLSDDRTFVAEVVGTDEKTDIAVLKIDANELSAAKLGDSESINVGEWVLAIGSPFGLDQTVTAGIVSAKGRADVGITDYEDFVQTDAAINPGNSGGPLVNLHGQVIGINTAIASRTGGYMGVGFAIPSNMARSVMDSIIDDGQVQRGWLGAAIQDLNKDLAKSFGYGSTDGVLTGDVVPDGPGEKAGLRSGDIIVKFGGKNTSKASQLRNTVAATSPNTETEMVVFRDGKMKTLKVVVGELDSRAGWQSNGRESSADLGISVQTLTPEIARQIGADEQNQGVVVIEVEPGSLASGAGIRPKDVILSVGNSVIRNAADFRKAIGEHNISDGIRLLVKRGPAQRFVFLRGRR